MAFAVVPPLAGLSMTHASNALAASAIRVLHTHLVPPENPHESQGQGEREGGNGDRCRKRANGQYQATPAHLPTDRRQRFDVNGDGAAVVVAERGGALDHFSHAGTDKAETGSSPRLQKRGNIINAPFTDSRFGIRSDVGRL